MSAAAILEVPINAGRDRSGLYTWAGVKYPSVTTVIQMFGGDYLTPWAAKMSAVECAEIVQRRLDGKLTLEESDEMVLDWPARMTAHIRERDHAARRGSLVHHCLYEWALGVKISNSDFHDYLLSLIYKLALIDEERDGEREGSYADKLAKETRHYVANAFAWLEKDKPEFEAIGQEAMVVNETDGYAGTMDAIAKLRGKRQVLDFKNTKAKQERKWQLQTEAYRHAEFIGLAATGEKCPMPETEGSSVIWIRPIDPVEVVYLPPRDDYYHAFLSIREAYGVLHDMPKPNARTRKPAEPKRDRYTAGF
jgi:hypothetical protein